MLVDLSQAQDIEAGDGTTSVVVLCGSLLIAVEKLLQKGLHPTVISEAFGKASQAAVEVLEGISVPVTLEDREQLIKCAATSLNSKVVSQYSDTIAPMVVDAVLKVRQGDNCDLRDIKIIKKLEGTIEDTELVDGVVFDRNVSHTVSGSAASVTGAKIALVQFCLSPPKTDLDNQVIVSDYAQMDRVLREERQYILGICKKIKVVKDIERDDVEFLCRSLGCKPIANVDNFTADKLGIAENVEEVSLGSGRCVKVTGAQVTDSKTVTVLVRGSNKLILEEADRSIHDALCVVRCLVKKRALIAGGGAPETEIAQALMAQANTLTGPEGYCFKAFAEAFEVIPFTLAENAGLNPIETVTKLR